MKLTPLYNKHLELGATMYTTGTGYAMPSFYRPPAEEARAVRERVGMIDLSLMSRLDLKGAAAFTLVQKLIVNDAARLKDGQALYTTLCNERGMIMDDVVVMRFEQQHFRIVTSSMFRRKTYEWLRLHMAGLDVQLTDVSSGIAMIGVQGPKSRDLLRGVTDIDVGKLGFFRFASGSLENMPCMIARLGFSGELGYECYFNTEDGVAAWNAIAAAGKPYGIVPYGMDTLDLLRLEKGFIFFGYDATQNDNPYECGLWPFISYESGDFIGRQALLAIKERGPAKKLLGLEISGEKPAAAGQPLMSGNVTIGTIVAGFRSPTLERNLAYAYLNAPHFETGREVSLEVEGARQKGTVVPMPFLDPDGKRMRQ
jgi:aminomethyltransferase